MPRVEQDWEVNFEKAHARALTEAGTLSLMSALTELGYRPYHMACAYPNAHVEFPAWTEALEIKYGKRRGTPWGRREFDKLLGRYDVSTWPYGG